jgi:hypothetical protein
MSKKHIMIIIVSALLVLCAVICAVFFAQSSLQCELIFTLFRPELQKASDDFYSGYLSDNPIVANYSGKIISLKRSKQGYNYGYYIKFGMEPYLGPHDPVGYDEAEYFVNNSGTITLLNFSHKKNYEIPSRLGVTIKKPIPTS